MRPSPFVTVRLACTILLGVFLLLPAGHPPARAGIPGADGFRVLFGPDSVYHPIVVAEDAVARYLRFDRSFQSGMYLRDPFSGPFLYVAYAHLGLVFRPEAQRVLVVGLGGGSIPKRFWRDYPAMLIEVAELDPMVVDVAKRFFGVPEDLRLRIVAQDGRLFLRNTRQRYDMIILDAYFAESIPFHLTTREFMQLARSRLAPGGIVLSNVIGALRGAARHVPRVPQIRGRLLWGANPGGGRPGADRRLCAGGLAPAGLPLDAALSLMHAARCRSFLIATVLAVAAGLSRPAEGTALAVEVLPSAIVQGQAVRVRVRTAAPASAIMVLVDGRAGPLLTSGGGE